MGIFSGFRRWLARLFRKKDLKIGIYGAPNAGKTTLANRISMDWTDEAMGLTSPIPHETNEVIKKKIIISIGKKKVAFNVFDTPGVATKVDFHNFVEEHGMDEVEGKRRAKQGTLGVMEAIEWLDKMDGILLVMDSALDPFNQVNVTILGNCRVRSLPAVIVANKVDLDDAAPEKIKEGFDEDPVVALSALTGKNMKSLYKEMLKHFQ